MTSKTVSIEIEFEVEPIDIEEDEFDDSVAERAADYAAFHYLSLVKISGYNTDSKSVEVDVGGFGKCKVSLA